MVQLFYGTFVTERKLEGGPFIRSFRVRLGSAGAQLCGSVQVKPCVTRSSSVSTPCR